MNTTTPASLTSARLLEALDRLRDVRVLIVGDIMLDEYLLGDAERISPEAPVPVVQVEKSLFFAGGAGNVARNIKALGGDPLLVSACGDGYNSAKLRRTLEDEGLAVRLTALAGRPATTKTRVLARQQQMLRIDQEDSRPLEPASTSEVLRQVEAEWPTSRVLILSDYNKGLVTPALMAGLQALKKKYPQGPQILVDPKTSNFHLYREVDLLTPNTKETSEGAGLPARNREEILAAGRAIFAKLGCHSLLTTLGAQGMALFEGPDQVLHIPTAARHVYDVTGAGDTVIATVGLGLAAGLALREACLLANYAAGIVVGEVGAATASPQEMRAAITGHAPAWEAWS